MPFKDTDRRMLERIEEKVTADPPDATPLDEWHAETRSTLEGMLAAVEDLKRAVEALPD